MRHKNKILALVFSILMLVVIMCVCSVIWPEMAWVFSDGFVEVSDEYCLVIDPGHGGFDGGAVSKAGVCEKDINLAIALSLKDIARDYPVKVILTREEDVALGENKQEDLKARKAIIDEANADLTISIHLNSYPSDELVYGPQVFYAKKEQKRTT